ncbi:MAG: ORF6N domain-containing protein [Bacteroidales bacterium]
MNEQVKRNIERFPEDFMFQMTDNDKFENLMSQNAMVNVMVMCAFVEMRRFLINNMETLIS